MKRLALILYRACKFRSISTAMWIDQYENFTPKHGK